ncbi:MAG: SpoIID/LytB domain-containing protein [Elusimicrobiota bacterium]
MTRTLRLGLLSCAVVLTSWRTLSTTAQTLTAPAQNFILEGNHLYYAGRHAEAIAAYQMAIRRDPSATAAYLNGAMVWKDLGAIETAAKWFRRAAELSPEDAAVRLALAESEFHQGRLALASEEAGRVLASRPRDVEALLLKGRIALAAGTPKEACGPLERAARLSPESALVHFWLGKALEAAGDTGGAARAFEQAAAADSYFVQARFDLSRTFARQGRLLEAWREAAKTVKAAPMHEAYRRLELALRPRLKDSLSPAIRRVPTPSRLSEQRRYPPAPPATGRIPVLRVGIGTSAMGHPRPWKGVLFYCSTRFTLRDSAGRILLEGRPREAWRLDPAGEGSSIQAQSANGLRTFWSRTEVVIVPESRSGWTRLREARAGRLGAEKELSRTLRGLIEVSRRPHGGLKVVDVVDLESYTHGVLSAEMPIASPIEALKAQAVLARTHALFIMRARQRHAEDGYHLCDGQHCQVYLGVGSETPRSRSVVDATRGRIVTSRGRVAHVVYSANCGGHTQGSCEIKGWGGVSHFSGGPDSPGEVPLPASPWELRLWLRSRPPSYCSLAARVQPSHFRWTRVIPAQDLEKRLNRLAPIGTLKAIVPLRRSASGHLNSVLVRGSRESMVIDTEMGIRSLLGVGSQRSSLFVLDTEYGPDGSPANFLFHGGGWGHGVGFCQAGAMGRAEQGQSYAEILAAYYRGIEIGDLRY